jgi:hypothetical protein
MDVAESKVHSFIVKLWLEEPDDDTERAGWHGHITHVPSGARRYLQDLGDILSFMKPYIGETGAGDDGARGSRARSWLKPWARRKR